MYLCIHIYVYVTDLILTDSLGRSINYDGTVDIIFQPGATISKMKDSIKDIDISKYKSITLLIGTNDL